MASLRIKQIVMDVKASLPPAQEAMQKAEKWLSCQDQHQDLMAAVDEVLRTLRGGLSSEGLAAADYARAEAQRDLMEGRADVTLSLFKAGYRTPQRPTRQAPPLGKVWVAVGLQGVPDGLRVFNVSNIARVEGSWELAVVNRLVTQGNLLSPPKAFERLVAWLGTKVLVGNINLPYHPKATDSW